MLRFDLVPINLGVRLQIDRVEVQPMIAGNQGKRLLEVGPEFVRRSRFSRIVSRDGKPTPELSIGILESPHIISLPTVDGDRDVLQPLDGSFGINAKGGILFAGKFVHDEGVGKRGGHPE